MEPTLSAATGTSEPVLLWMAIGAAGLLLVQQLVAWLPRRHRVGHLWAATWGLGAGGWSVARWTGLHGQTLGGVSPAVAAAVCLAIMAGGILGVIGNLRRPAMPATGVLAVMGAGLTLALAWAAAPPALRPVVGVRRAIGGAEISIVDPGFVVGIAALGLTFLVTVAMLRLALRQGRPSGDVALVASGALVWLASLCNDLLFAMGLWVSTPLHAAGALLLAVVLGAVLARVPVETGAGAAAPGAPGPRGPPDGGRPDEPARPVPFEDQPTRTHRALDPDDGYGVDRDGRDDPGGPRSDDMLLEALAEARAASEERQRFLARASHELRTPLHGILGMTELALEGPLDPTRRRYLEAAHRSAQEMLALVEQLLTLARTESDRFELAAEPIGLQGFLDDVLDLVAQQAADKGIELYSVVSPGLPTTVIGDPQRLRQVLVNLVGNAVKFTERGHVAVRVSELPAAAGRVGLRFAVEDTGPGIPEEEQALVMEAFGQGAVGRGRGTGLGLAVCAELLRRMGSELRLESRVGEGTTFSFEVELDLVDPTDEITVIDPVLVKGERVLIADDHPGSAASLKSELAAWRLVSTTVGSGEEARVELERARATGRPYTVLLVDAEMPGVDGWALLDLVAGPDAPEPGPAVILMLPPDAPPGQDAEAFRRGARAVIGKPLRVADLHQALLQAVGALRAPTPVSPRLAGSSAGIVARVLVVDDRPINRDVTRAFLETMHCEVVTVGDGPAAVERVAAERFDLVLMDIEMPGMSGDEATARIRSQERRSGRQPVPIVALTAHAGTADRERFARAGMDAVLQKPLTRGELRDLVDRLVPAGPIRQDPAAADPARRVDDVTPADPTAPTARPEPGVAPAPPGTRADRMQDGVETLPPVDDDTGDQPRVDLQELPSGPLDPRLASAHGLPLVLPPPQADDLDGAGGADAILDPDRLDEIADGSLSLKRELVAIFLAELPRYEEWLRAALVSGEAADLERAGHALAGASANLALRELSATARRLCDTARAGDVDMAAWIAVEVLGAAERARGALRRWEEQWASDDSGASS